MDLRAELSSQVLGKYIALVNEAQGTGPSPAETVVTAGTGQVTSKSELGDVAVSFNIASRLIRLASTTPNHLALIDAAARSGGRATRKSLTCVELEGLSNRFANGLSAAGIERGMRVLVMVPQGFEFVALTFALFKMGAIPVMIDPGMGVGRLLECVRQVDPNAFVGVPLAHAVRVMRPTSFRSVKHFVTVGRRWFWGGPKLRVLCERAGDDFALAQTQATDTAAILFTSGSTGPAKGVVYEHGMFDAQVRMIQSNYSIEPGEVDVPTFPLFALFSVAMGMTAVIPEMDASRPGRVNPIKIVNAVRDHQATSTFGSPALWRRVAAYCVEGGVKLPSLRRILIAGAPVPLQLIEQLHQVIDPSADVHTPYGATESLPVTSIGGREILEGCADASRAGLGTCVGRPVEGIEVRVIRITDDPIEEWSDDLELVDGEIGELVVAGPVVTKEYSGLQQATINAKIRDRDRTLHRMGDLGYRDGQGRIWFCGRKAHRVVTPAGTMFTVCCEAIFNEHPDVARSALVGVGPPPARTPLIIIEPTAERFPRGRRVGTFTEELLRLGRANRRTARIERVLFRRTLPVDVRHNAKINREALALWARALCR